MLDNPNVKWVWTVQNRIRQLRHQMLVHSCLYYHLNRSMIGDYEYDLRARELHRLQTDHPEDSKAVEDLYDMFHDWTGETGSHLPVREGWVIGKSMNILTSAKHLV